MEHEFETTIGYREFRGGRAVPVGPNEQDSAQNSGGTFGRSRWKYILIVTHTGSRGKGDPVVCVGYPRGPRASMGQAAVRQKETIAWTKAFTSTFCATVGGGSRHRIHFLLVAGCPGQAQGNRLIAHFHGQVNGDGGDVAG